MSASRDRVVLAVVVFVVLLAQVLVYPGVDSLVTRFGADHALGASTWFLAVEFAAFVAFAIVWGAASDATQTRAPLIRLSAIAGAVGYLALAVVPTLMDASFAAVLAIRAFQGAATIGAFSLGMTMLMDLGGGHGRNMGAAGIAIGAGTALGAPIGGQLYEVATLAPLYAAAALLVGIALLTGRLTDRVPTGTATTLKELAVTLRSTPHLGVPYAFGFIDRLTAGFFALVGTLYFRTAFGLGPGATGGMLALFFAPFAVLQYPMGIVSDRVGRPAPIIVGSALYGAGVVAVGAASTVAGAGAAMVAVGVLGATMAPATMALVTDLAGAGERGVAMAGFNAAGSFGFLTGIVLGGAVATASGFWLAFLAAGLVEIGLALVALPAFVLGDIPPRRP